MEKVLTLIKKIIPPRVFRFFQPAYHWTINGLAALIYGFPSHKLLIIGITGTTGKTTTTYFLARILREAGYQVGYTSTALLSDGKKDWLNDKKMTMLGRFFTQKILKQMIKNGCQIAIIETTSEGIRQFRHRFINYDILIFTGLYPEHLESHGGFKNYKQAKLKLFQHLAKSAPKKSLPIPFSSFPKTILVNGDDKHSSDFLNFSVPQKIIIKKENTLKNQSALQEKNNKKTFFYQFIQSNAKGLQFKFNQKLIHLNLLGNFNALNATLAGRVAKILGIKNKTIKKALEKIKNIPGHLEKIEAGQNFSVIVDYAFEPRALAALYKTIASLQAHHIIHVLGSAGGGRDKSRRFSLGKIAGEKADIVIITNEDPYDEDPLKIMEMVAEGVRKAGKKDNDDLFLIEDRRQAICQAIILAQENDLVLITGKGSEQAICVRHNQKIPWDDRQVAREEIKKKLLENKKKPVTIINHQTG